MISLPLPDAQQRAAFIAKRSLHLLSDFINHADKDIVQKYLPLKMINVNGEILHNGDSNEDEEINRHNGSRKNDLQKGNANNDNCNYDGNDNRNSSPVRSSDSTYKVYKMKLEKLQKTNYSEDFSSNHETLPLFDIEYCLLKSVLLSENWSLRYIGKALSNIRSEVLGTERYVHLRISIFFIFLFIFQSEIMYSSLYMSDFSICVFYYTFYYLLIILISL